MRGLIVHGLNPSDHCRRARESGTEIEAEPAATAIQFGLKIAQIN